MKDLILFVGDHYLDYEDWGEYRRTVSSYSVHPLYNANAFNDFDIALLRLSTPANFSATVAPIKLPAAPPQDNQTCLAAGRSYLTFVTLILWVICKVLLPFKTINAESQRKIDQINKFL